MSRSLLILSVALAAYTVLSTGGAALLAAAWRAGLVTRGRFRPEARARRLAWLRAAPSLGAAALTAAVVLPAYLTYEPAHAFEAVGPVLLLLALAGAWLIGSGMIAAARTALVTGRLERQWLRRADRFDTTPPAGVPAFLVDVPAPVVALVGVVAPKLVATRPVVDACSPAELALIVAHERGHLCAHDNLKRWLLGCAPDALRWTSCHRAMLAAWHDAAEEAADDAATGGRERTRVDLAALLVKIARLAPAHTWARAAVSPLVDADGLDRRVRRLLAPPDHPRDASRPAWVTAAAASVIAAALSTPASWKAVHEIAESLVALGR